MAMDVRVFTLIAQMMVAVPRVLSTQIKKMKNAF
jgi:hypothetical protein